LRSEPLPAEHIATVAIDGGVLRVLREPGAVAITDASPAMSTMRPAQARELGELIDTATGVDTPVGVIGRVLRTNGRPLFVKKFPYHVGLADTPEAHSGHTLRCDQARDLRDALDRAAGAVQPA